MVRKNRKAKPSDTCAMFHAKHFEGFYAAENLAPCRKAPVASEVWGASCAYTGKCRRTRLRVFLRSPAVSFLLRARFLPITFCTWSDRCTPLLPTRFLPMPILRAAAPVWVRPCTPVRMFCLSAYSSTPVGVPPGAEDSDKGGVSGKNQGMKDLPRLFWMCFRRVIPRL